MFRFWYILCLWLLAIGCIGWPVYAQRFDQGMSQSTQVLQGRLDPTVAKIGVWWLSDLVISVLTRIIIPIVIAIGILTVIIGMYSVMTSTSDKDTSKGTNYIIRWTIGIIVMMSAQFIGTTLFTDIFGSGQMSSLNGVQIAQQVYEKILFPFLTLFIYLSLGILFIVLLTKTIQYITNTAESIQKQAINTILFTVVGILMIIWSKQIVELVYGTQQQVLNRNASNIGEIWVWALSDKNIEFFYQIINRVLGLTTFIILLLIVIQVFQMIINPDDENLFTKVKNTFIYVFIGILIIWAGYLIANFFIIV